jgi:hypothetical protein
MAMWVTRLRHLGEEWLTGEGSQRRWRLDGGGRLCLAGGAEGGASGRASGHWGVMVELKDGAAAPDEDPRRSVTRSAPAAAKLDGAQRWLADVTCGGRRGEQ